MEWLFPRIAVVVVALLCGGGAGFVLGTALLESPLRGMLVGAGVGVSYIVARDTLCGHRLIQWMKRTGADRAPSEAGLWGELAYRVQRTLELRDAAIEVERVRLSQFFEAMEAAPNGVLLLDAEDQIDWCNSMAAHHFGLDPIRDRKQPVTNLIRTPAFVNHLQAGRHEDSVLFANPREPGTLSVAIRPYGDGMKLVISQDITERERTDAMRRHFVANVSHEIRTPLTVLVGFLETMQTVPVTEVERSRMLSVMMMQATRMQDLVNDLLTLARLEGSPRPPSDTWIAVRDLLVRVQGDTQALSSGKHTVLLEWDDDQASADLAGIESEVLSAVHNLTANAVRYTPEGGTITIRWHVRDDGCAELSVMDTGIGVDPCHIPKLTERFYRVDGSRSRDTGGTGLGLSIVKHVTQRHGGELRIDSVPHQGSTFTMSLPAARIRRRPVSFHENVIVSAVALSAA